MNIVQAGLSDIDELIRMRIAYIMDDFGSVDSREREYLEKQLSDYFRRKLGTELIAFAAKDGDRIVSTACLHMMEMPANLALWNGLYGEVLSVYTEPSYRGQGLCTRLMKALIAYGQEKGLGRIDLKATPKGYPLYKRLGFTEKEAKYTDMRYTYDHCGKEPFA